MRAPRTLLLGLSAALSACAAKRPPPLQDLTLGETQLAYRDYSQVQDALCDANPRLLGLELQEVNEALEQFLARTEGAANPEATAEEVELLREGTTALRPMVEAHDKNLAGLGGCGFMKQAPFPELAQKGEGLLQQAKARLDEAPAVLAAADQRLAEQKWREESAARETTAQQTWCAGKVTVGSGDLYYARQEPDGKMRWLFCDGIVVEWVSGAEPAVLVPDSLSRRERRRISDKRYLEAVKAYPPEEIDKLGALKKPEAQEE